MTVQWGVTKPCVWCHGRGCTRNGEPCGSCRGAGFTDGSVAPVRRDDPETSRAAAASVTDLTGKQRRVLEALRQYGPMTDETLYRCLFETAREDQSVMSPSGARTRRHELEGLGLVEDTGRTEVLSTGNRGKVWRAA